MSTSGCWIFKNPARRNLNQRKLRSLKQRTAPLRIRGNACTRHSHGEQACGGVEKRNKK